MPLYEYRCRDCEREFEKYVRTWGEAVSCPACEGASVERLLSSFAFAAADQSFSSSAGGGCGCGRGSCNCHS